MNRVTLFFFLAIFSPLLFMSCGSTLDSSAPENENPPEEEPPEEYEPRPTATQNLVVVTLDGVRWQEVFKGADSALIHNTGYIAGDAERVKEKFWADTEEQRRQKLMPFFWAKLVQEGKLYGNRDFENKVHVTNSSRKSIPGYCEIWTGYADPSITTNNTPPNPHINVLEFLNKQSGFEGDNVQAVVPTKGFERVLNVGRSNLSVHNVKHEDLIIHDKTMQILKNDHPRVVYMALIDTDHYAHEYQYDNYLYAIHEADSLIGSLWEYLQQDEFYRDKTTLLITTDHGRGIGSEWHTHGSGGVAHAEETWFAIAGPDTQPTGEQKEEAQIKATQFAKTMAALLEFNFNTGRATGALIESVMDM